MAFGAMMRNTICFPTLSSFSSVDFVRLSLNMGDCRLSTHCTHRTELHFVAGIQMVATPNWHSQFLSSKAAFSAQL